MEFLKKNYILILIFILGAFLRINIDTFALGCNFDEFAIMSLAKLDILSMLKAIATLDYHAPFYYFFAHIVSNFEHKFIILRLFNAFISTLNIYLFYKIGKTIIDKKLGYILALIFAVNHLQISVSNFAKFYCLAIFLTTLSIYYFIKSINTKKTNYKLTLTNIILILTHTFGFIFVGIEYLILHLNKVKIKKLVLLTSIGFMLFLPILIIQTKTALFSGITSPHGDYPTFSPFAFYNFINDYFTPLINYSCNIETIEGASLVLKGIKSIISNETPIDYISIISFVILSLIPVIISIIGLIISIKNKLSTKVLLLSIGYLLFFILITMLEITGFIPLYIFSSGIILIICSILGLYLIKSKIKFFLIGYLVFAQLLITNVYPLEKREVPYKNYANIDSFIEKIENNTPIVIIDAGRFSKCYYNHKNIFEIDYEKLKGSHTKKWIELTFGEEIAQKINKKNAKEILKPLILNKEKSKNLEKYLEKNLFSKIKKDEKLVLIFDSDGKQFVYKDEEIRSFLNKKYNPNLIDSSFKNQLNENSNNEIHQYELGEVLQSYITKEIIREIEKKFKPIKLEQFKPIPNKSYIKNYEQKENIEPIINLMELSLEGWIFVTYQKL